MASFQVFLLITTLYTVHSQCSNDTADTLCIIDGGSSSTPTCRSNDPCEINCGTKKCIDKQLNGQNATDVTITCSGQDACKGKSKIICGTGDCLLYCNNSTTSCENTTITNPNQRAHTFRCYGYCSQLNGDDTIYPIPFPITISTIISACILIAIIPSLGMVFLVSIIKFIMINKRLNKSGTVTKAQIINKYIKGSKDFYKSDEGKSYFILCEFIVSDKMNTKLLCRSKYMVNKMQYHSHSIGHSVDLIYLPNNYSEHNNLQFLNKHVVKTKIIFFRILVALIIIFILPMIVSILTKQYDFFIYPILISMFYYIIGYYLFVCVCPNKTWFINKSFKSRIAFDDDLQRFYHINNNVQSIENDVEQNIIDDDAVIKFNKDKRVKTDDKRVSLLSDDSDLSSSQVQLLPGNDM